jgi:acyl-coenzyme A thioesterase 13
MNDQTNQMTLCCSRDPLCLGTSLILARTPQQVSNYDKMATEPDDKCLAHVNAVWASMRPNSPIYDLFLKDISIRHATTGAITARLDVLPIHLNSKGTLHGGVTSCIMDWAGSMGVASFGADKTGVSVDLHVTYISTAKEGDTLVIEVEAVVGSTLAFTNITILKEGRDGTHDSMKGRGGLRPIVATGTHTKYVRQPKPSTGAEEK